MRSGRPTNNPETLPEPYTRLPTVCLSSCFRQWSCSIRAAEEPMGLRLGKARDGLGNYHISLTLGRPHTEGIPSSYTF